jgi:hypothetical protein
MIPKPTPAMKALKTQLTKLEPRGNWLTVVRAIARLSPEIDGAVELVGTLLAKNHSSNVREVAADILGGWGPLRRKRFRVSKGSDRKGTDQVGRRGIVDPFAAKRRSSCNCADRCL